MGRNKAALPVDATTLAELIVARLRPVVAEILVCANDPEAVPTALRPDLVVDLHPGLGPLSGIEAALSQAKGSMVFCLACDMPRVTPELVTFLISMSTGQDAVVPLVGGRLQTTCAVYSRRLIPLVSAALAAGRPSVHRALMEWRTTGVATVSILEADQLEAMGFGPELFVNLNTPAEYEQYRRSSGLA
jgi:molybdopterin-guanine dinucleotide biosynthesis protein A